jgi:NAD+ synthase (glutamine-hydrolysing)
MSATLHIVSAQLNFHVGDLTKNLAMHIRAAENARDEHHADLIVFPELSLTGYPPEDLLLRRAFISQCEQALRELTGHIKGIYCLVGHPQLRGEDLYNASSLIFDGKILATYAKFHLPNYGVFDEKRYFKASDEPCVVNIKGVPTGIIICEDVWSEGPMQKAVTAGARIILVPNASPFEADKHEQRLEILSQQARRYQTPIVYVNNVGGQDELVFDGGSMLMSSDGKMSHFSGFFNESLMPITVNMNNDGCTIDPASTSSSVPSAEIKRIYQALVMGTRDYIEKNNFPGVLIGLSGGIDSALTAAVAVDALGAERVHGVFMPSRYTSTLSGTEVEALAKLLAIKTTTLSIEGVHAGFLSALAPQISPAPASITEQNIQSRCRCILLMALSNASGKLVLTTGNRSEVAVGYCTLYGDMSGGYAPLKNVPKTLIYQLAKYRNSLSPAIPLNTIQREPSAELAPNQKDQDSLPPYPELDQILENYLNHGYSITEMIALGFDAKVVNYVVSLIHRNEYKRKQYAVGPQIHRTSFIKDWRYPITNGFKG